MSYVGFIEIVNIATIKNNLIRLGQLCRKRTATWIYSLSHIAVQPTPWMRFKANYKFRKCSILVYTTIYVLPYFLPLGKEYPLTLNRQVIKIDQ